MSAYPGDSDGMAGIDPGVPGADRPRRFVRNIVARSWRQMVVAALLIAVDLAVNLPIVGATRRPFGWMSQATTGLDSSFYPVIQDVSFQGTNLWLSVKFKLGDPYVLERATNLLDSSGWTNVASAAPTGTHVRIVDSNPAAGAGYYRVIQILP